jgi:hypothetical protein
MVATKIVFPRMSKDNNGPAQIAVWISNPLEGGGPDPTISYDKPDGTILYLVQEYYSDEVFSLHVTSGYSALAYLLEKVRDIGGVMDGGASTFIAREKRLSSLEVLRRCGGIVQ